MGAATFGRDLSGNYICPFPACGKWFPNPRNAQRHFDSTHSGIEYKCQICSASFGRKDSLKRHAMNTHKLNEKMAQAMLKLRDFSKTKDAGFEKYATHSRG